jgi:hypothetical protein
VLLAQSHVDRAMVALSPSGVTVRTPSWPWPREWTVAELEVAAAEQQRWRARLHPSRQARELASRLRVVGAALDGLPPQSYILSVQDTTIRVLGTTGYQHIFDEHGTTQDGSRAAHPRGQDIEALVPAVSGLQP